MRNKPKPDEWRGMSAVSRGGGETAQRPYGGVVLYDASAPYALFEVIRALWSVVYKYKFCFINSHGIYGEAGTEPLILSSVMI